MAQKKAAGLNAGAHLMFSQGDLQDHCEGSKLAFSGLPLSPSLKLMIGLNCLLINLVIVAILIGRSVETSIVLMSLSGELRSTPSAVQLSERGYVCTMRSSSVPSSESYATEVCSVQHKTGVLALVEVYFKEGVHCGTLLVPRPRTVRFGDLVLLWGMPQPHQENTPVWWVEYDTPVYTPHAENFERFVLQIRLAGAVPC
jgi:hypothetical protein